MSITVKPLIAGRDLAGVWPQERIDNWGDDAWWQTQIDQAVASVDPVWCNLRITLAHQELSLALQRITGAGSGANFHTWAVWGSKKAGTTIRQEDVPHLPRSALGVGAVVGGGGTAALTRGGVRRRAGAFLASGGAVGVGLDCLARCSLQNATSRIFGGNVTVLTDIGRQTSRFVSAFLRPQDRTDQKLAEFLALVRPGPASAGGQQLLREGYRHYLAASRETDPDRRDEHMLLANLLAILHEHRRLEPYIDASIPRPLRRVVTEHLLGFTVGAETLRVSHDVPAPGRAAFSRTLRTIESPELEQFLAGPGGWDSTPDTLAGSAAHDWTKLSERMNFIVDLFRSRQGDPNLLTPPYSVSQRDLILTGVVPPGPL